MNDSIIGLDAVVLTVTGTFLKQIEQRVVRRNKQGRLYLEVNRTKQNDSYNVTIILPSIIRPSNLQGFSIFDSIKLEYLIEVIKEDLQDIIGTTNLNNLVVKQVEINANKHVSHKVDVDMITAFFARALLKTDAQLIEHCHGKNIKQARTIKTKIIDGFKTERNTSKRFYTKVYNKTRQLGIEDKKKCSVFRLEQIYTSLGVSQALGKKGKVTLADILQKQAMQKLIQRYVVDVRQCIIPPIRLYLQDATNIVLNELKQGNGAYKVFLKWYDIVQYDYRIYRTALKKFYKLVGNTEQSANVQASRIKAKAKAEGIVVSEGMIKELEELFREIRIQEI